MEAADALRASGEKVGVVLLEMLKPFAPVTKALLPYLANAERIVFVEEGIKNGGACMVFCEELRLCGFDFSKCAYDIAAINDDFVSPEAFCDLYDYAGLSPQKIVEKMK